MPPCETVILLHLKDCLPQRKKINFLQDEIVLKGCFINIFVNWKALTATTETHVNALKKKSSKWEPN